VVQLLGVTTVLRNCEMLVEYGAGCQRVGLTLMRPPLVKRHTTPVSGIFPLFGPGEAGVWSRGLTSFLCADAAETCLHQTLIEVRSPLKRRLHRVIASLCDLETYRRPHTVLFKEVAEPWPVRQLGPGSGEGQHTFTTRHARHHHEEPGRASNQRVGIRDVGLRAPLRSTTQRICLARTLFPG
jgi:hypothetical protein